MSQDFQRCCKLYSWSFAHLFVFKKQGHAHADSGDQCLLSECMGKSRRPGTALWSGIPGLHSCSAVGLQHSWGPGEAWEAVLMKASNLALEGLCRRLSHRGPSLLRLLLPLLVDSLHSPLRGMVFNAPQLPPPRNFYRQIHTFFLHSFWGLNLWLLAPPISLCFAFTPFGDSDSVTPYCSFPAEPEFQVCFQFLFSRYIYIFVYSLA